MASRFNWKKIFLTGCLSMVVVGLALVAYGAWYLYRTGYLVTWNDNDGKVYSGVVYDEKSGNKYDLYMPAKVTPQTSGRLMLFIHGGGWAMGRREDMTPFCRYYAKQGYMTATLDYTLLPMGVKNDMQKPHATVPLMLTEIGRCLAHLKKHTAELGQPVKQAALSGASAGGHLALLYGYSQAAKSPVPLAFIFAYVPPTAFTDIWDDNFTAEILSHGTGQKITPAMLRNGSAAAAIKSVTPVEHVSSQSLPTLAAFGAKDEAVRPVHRERLEKALTRFKVPHKCVVFPNSGHMLFMDPDKTAEYRQMVLDYARQYFKD